MPGIVDDRLSGLARAFVHFLPPEDRARHPTYWTICNGIANDPSLLEIAALVPPPQFAVNVLLAAVHDLLLDGVRHPLAARYKSVCDRIGSTYEAVDDDQLVGEFASFCHDHRDAIAMRCETRSTQTNEVGRSAAILAVLSTLRAAGTDRVGIVDAGCSAGLNLHVDAYGYDLSGTVVGDPAATPRISCELRGAMPPTVLPQIADRVGLDQSVVEVTDPAATSWLLACLWPDDLDRFRRLEAALDVAIARRDEVRFVEGDMVERIADSAALVTDDVRLVIMDCWAAAYLPPSRRGELAAAIARIAAARPVTWVSMEAPAVCRDLGVLGADAVLSHPGSSVVCVTTLGATPTSPSLAAEVHNHGLWLDWRA